MIGQTFSHYRIVSQLGAGGMGIVYVAEDTMLHRSVAIKFASRGEIGQERLLEEARSASALSHPNIARIYECDEDEEGRLYVVMELVRGRTLQTLLKEGPLAVPQAVSILEDVLAALSEAHRVGITHRDIKPSNVMIDERGVVKVLDFGLAKRNLATWAAAAGISPEDLPTPHTTISNNVIGTPAFMSPEQVRAQTADARSDIFACGSLLYLCLTGHPAFHGATSPEILGAVLHLTPKLPSEHVGAIPEVLERIVMKAVEKHPVDRFQTADEMRLDLAAFRQGPCATACGTETLTCITPEPTPRPKWTRRQWSIAGLIVAAALAGFYWYLNPSPAQPAPAARRWYDQGLNALRDSTYYSAKVALERVVQADPEFVNGHVRLADAWAELDSTESAKEELLLALRRTHGFVRRANADEKTLEAIQAVITHDYRTAIARYTDLVNDAPAHEKSRAWLDLGRVHEKANNIEQALSCYAEAIRLDGEYSAAFLRRGILLGRQRKVDPAERDFRQAQTIFEASRNQEGVAKVFYERGTLLATQGQLAAATTALTRSRDISRLDGNEYQELQAGLKLAVVKYQEGESVESEKLAKQALDRARTLGTPYLTARGLIDLAIAQSTRRDFASAEKNFREAIDLARREKLERSQAWANLNLGQVLIQAGHPDQAAGHLESALTYHRKAQFLQETLNSQIGLGRIRRDSGDYASADNLYKDALKTAEEIPDHRTISLLHQDVGSLYSLWERWPEALAWFQKRFELEMAQETKSKPNVAFSLASQTTVLARMGALDRADALAGEIERLCGDNPQAMLRLKDLRRKLLLWNGRWKEAAAAYRAELSKTGLSLAEELDFREGLTRALLQDSPKGTAWREAVLLLDRVGKSKIQPSNASGQAIAAEAALDAGQPKQALDLANEASRYFYGHEQFDSLWKIEAVASQAAAQSKLLDESARRRQAALEALNRLETRLGTNITKQYETLAETSRYRGLIRP